MAERILLFRADGNSDVGAGHIMRCISIADAAGKKGFRSVFMTAGAEFGEILRAHGHEQMVLGTDYRKMESETGRLVAALRQVFPEALIVDSYFVTPRYFSLLRACTGYRIVTMDDMALFPYDCDMLVNYNIYGGEWEAKYRYIYRDGGCPDLLLGTRFVPLREEFLTEKRGSVRKEGKQILVSTGGADTEHFTLALLDAIRRHPSDKVFHLILGSMNPDREEIRKRAAGLRDIEIHENVREMAKLMLMCDAAISAAGSTLYELCATQTPTITYVLEDNQKPGATAFEKSGILQNAGDLRETGATELADRLIGGAIALCDDEELREKISLMQQNAVDGCGADRIVDSITEK